MHKLKKAVPVFLLIFLIIIECIAQNANINTRESTDITLPGGITISSTSLIVGILAVIAVIIVGVVFAARRNNSGHSTTTIFRNNSNSDFRDVRTETNTSSPKYYSDNVSRDTSIQVVEIPPEEHKKYVDENVMVER